jgi:type VI secretion system protein ImpG
VSLADSGRRCARGVGTPAAPRDEEGPEALHALRAYFAWPALSAFVDLPNIDRAGPIASARGGFEIVVRLADALPRGVRVGPEDVRLHCVPAVNVHRLAPVVLPVEHGRIALGSLRGAVVYDVRGVRLLGDHHGARVATPHAAFAEPHAAGAESVLFRVERVASVVGPFPALSIVLESDADLTAFERAEIDVDVTDGERPERLGGGEIAERVAGSPSGVTFRNALPVTRTAAPVFEGDRLWRWLHLVKAGLPQLVSAPELAAFVALANDPAWARWPGAKAGREALEAIRAVRLGRSPGPDRRHVAIVVDVEVSAFDGAGDLDLFGERMAALFASTLRPYESVVLTLRDAGERTLFTYEPVAGTREGL